jgi:hypothetical protein
MVLSLHFQPQYAEFPQTTQFRAYMRIVLLLLFTILLSSAGAQTDSTAALWIKPVKDFRVRMTFMNQFFGYYTMGQEVWNASANRYDPVDNRINFTWRRSRVVFKGEPYNRLRFTVVLYYDHIGRDLLSGGVGGTNRDQPNVGIWDAFFQYRLSSQRDGLVLTFGYFRPQMQRESITSAWATNSFEKSMSQNYVRRHLTGTGPGRAAGLNIGGLIGEGVLRLNYNAGIFNPLTTGLNGASVGIRYSPLVAGRVVLSIGDPELDAYRIGYTINSFGKRHGLSLDFNASWQGGTDVFSESLAFGPGLLFNWGPLNVDGEWVVMRREGERPSPDGSGNEVFRASSATGHIRMGYNIQLGRIMLEPTGMWMHFSGGLSEEEQLNAFQLAGFSGSETTWNAGVNVYLNKTRLKLAVAYTWRSGDPGSAADGATVNQFFSQSGVGAIRRGNYFGVGLSSVF